MMMVMMKGTTKMDNRLDVEKKSYLLAHNEILGNTMDSGAFGSTTQR